MACLTRLSMYVSGRYVVMHLEFYAEEKDCIDNASFGPPNTLHITTLHVGTLKAEMVTIWLSSRFSLHGFI